MSTMVFRPRKSRQAVHLSVTPLIDVLFLLIIFFMLTGTFKRIGELELLLPRSETASQSREEDISHQLELVITEDGRLRLDGEAVEMGVLQERLVALRTEDPERRVMLKAETEVDHGEVVGLLDIIRNAGFPGVGIGTHIGPAPGEPSPASDR